MKHKGGSKLVHSIFLAAQTGRKRHGIAAIFQERNLTQQSVNIFGFSGYFHRTSTDGAESALHVKIMTA